MCIRSFIALLFASSILLANVTASAICLHEEKMVAEDGEQVDGSNHDEKDDVAEETKL